MRYLSICFFLWANTSFAIPTDTAEITLLDKVSARSHLITIPVGDIVKVGPFSVIVRICDKAPPEQPPESGAYLDIVQDGEQVFQGWMFASEPAINSMEHPVYDIWLQRCL